MKRNTCFSCFLCSNGVSFELKYFIILLKFKKRIISQMLFTPTRKFHNPFKSQQDWFKLQFFWDICPFLPVSSPFDPLDWGLTRCERLPFTHKRGLYLCIKRNARLNKTRTLNRSTTTAGYKLTKIMSSYLHTYNMLVNG